MSGIVVLISGRGSNLKAICQKGLTKNIKCVISNKHDADGILFAKEIGLTTYIVNHMDFKTREEFDQNMAQIIDSYKPDLVVLAGFMRILSNWFVKHYEKRLINIHPSLLPAFAGTTTAQESAYIAKVKVSGVTIHFVEKEVDHGAIIAQGVVAVNTSDDALSLKARVLELEHVMYPFIIHKFINQAIFVDDNGFVIVKKDESDALWLGKFTNQIFL